MSTLTEKFPQCKEEILLTLVEYGLIDQFDHILSYLGDDELISSCNDEYCCDDDICFITDGITNHAMTIVNGHSQRSHLQYLHSIRGATFVILVRFGDRDQPSWDLRIDESCYMAAVTGIRNTLERFNEVNAVDDMQYYLKESKPGDNYCLHNDDSIISSKIVLS